MTDEDQILSRTDVLGLLSQKAREGSSSAMIALERALRIGSPVSFTRSHPAGHTRLPIPLATLPAAFRLGALPTRPPCGTVPCRQSSRK
jgi:hypothetical protein